MGEAPGQGEGCGPHPGFCLYSEAKGSRESGQVTVEGYHFIFRKLPPWSRRQMTADWGGGGGDANMEMRWKVGVGGVKPQASRFLCVYRINQ